MVSLSHHYSPGGACQTAVKTTAQVSSNSLSGIYQTFQNLIYCYLQALYTHTHTHNRFTAGLEYVRVHPGQQVPER